MSNIVTAESVLKIASAEIGYREKVSNSNLDNPTANAGGNNYTKYARDLAQAGYYNGNKNGYAWCDVFVDWCFYQAAGKNRQIAEAVECQTGLCGAGCLYSSQYYQAAGRWSNKPSVGAQIFFSYAAGEVSHTGIVEKFDATTVTTIEGNTSDMVARRTYRINDTHIYGYGLPKYEVQVNDGVNTPVVQPVVSVSTSVATTSVLLPILKIGNKGTAVKTLQYLLVKYGYSVGSYGVDGDFGAGTLSGVKSFQRAKNLEEDGVVGKDTWSKLLGVS